MTQQAPTHPSAVDALKPTRYTKKPVTIEAFLYTGKNTLDVWKWMGREYQYDLPETAGFVIKTLEGDMDARPGDFIIRGVKGEYYPCKPDIFALTYEQQRPQPDHGSDRAKAYDELKSLAGYCPDHFDESPDCQMDCAAFIRDHMTTLFDALAQPGDGGEWLPIEGEMSGNFVVTNNINARDGNGKMSHVWYTGLIQVSTSQGSTGQFICFDKAMHKIHGLTHYFEIPMPEALSQKSEA